MPHTSARFSALYRAHYRDVVAPLVRIVGFELAEELAQEAFATALDQWAAGTLPDEPVAWLRRVAKNRALDRVRRSTRWSERAARLQAEAQLHSAEARDPDVIADDLLRLIFTCCHPALAPEARLALTLHAVCGLTTDEIARAFLVARPTLQQRLVRAKRKIDIAGIPYEVPTLRDLPTRLGDVLHTLYVVFTEGYASTRDAKLVRSELCDQAIRLTRLIRHSLPEQPAVGALLALMLLHHARSPARIDHRGRLVRLTDQDRGRWNRQMIDEALPLVESSLKARPTPPYAIEAAIAALHDQAPTAEQTDWPQIAALYGALRLRGSDNPVVDLNHAVALAQAGKLEAGLALLDSLEASGRLQGYHLLYVARADLHERSGAPEQARRALERALELASNPVEREHLRIRLSEKSA